MKKISRASYGIRRRLVSKKVCHSEKRSDEESAFSPRPVASESRSFALRGMTSFKVVPTLIQKLILIFVVAISFAATAAFGHAEVSYNLRAAHFDYTPAGMMVYIRVSLSLLVANQLGRKTNDGSYIPAPYTFNRVESGRAFHYLDVKAVKRDAMGLGKLAIQGHEFSVAGKAIAPKLINVRVHPKGAVPPFARLEDAKNATKGLPFISANETDIDTGYVLVDVALLFPQISPTDEFQLKSSLVPGEIGEPATKNMFWDHRGADQLTPYAVEGLIDAAIVFSPPKK